MEEQLAIFSGAVISLRRNGTIRLMKTKKIEKSALSRVEEKYEVGEHLQSTSE